MLVCDNGIGIPVEHLERVFDRFTRVDTRLTREVHGLGLGLTMCKRVAQMHGGMIWVRRSHTAWAVLSMYVYRLTRTPAWSRECLLSIRMKE